MNLDVAICLPQEAESVSVIRRVVMNALETLGIAGTCIDDIGLALSEACTNVLDHARDDDEYEVRLVVDDRRCSISVKNTADGFDATALTDTDPGELSPRGRGVTIMRAVMDHVELTSEPEVGTIVRLVKALEIDQDGAIARLRRQD